MDEAGIDVGLTCAWYGPEGALIDNDEVDAVFIATPPYLHPEHFEAAAREFRVVVEAQSAALDVAARAETA